MTIEKYKHKTNAQSNRKGKYATSTENRRLMWEYIIWPLVLELNKSYFTIEEYHKMRDKVSIEKNISVSKMAEAWYLSWSKEFSLKIVNTIQFISN